MNPETGLFYDLHVHSALSPCADNDMTPAAIAGFLALSGAEVIAVTDHNSAKNLPAVKKACDHYGIRLIPGIEANTSEEIHLLCYFPEIGAALDMGERIYETLPDISADRSIWGEQLIIDENDRVTGRVEKLLTLASGFSIYELKAMTEKLGGTAVPAHADKDSYSLISVMGFLPEDLDFKTVELTRPCGYEEYQKTGVLPGGLNIITNSDAHALTTLTREPLPALGYDHPLTRLIL